MVDEHPDARVLLHVAFPERYTTVEEHWVMHVLSCPHCMEDILNMREMAHITSALHQENADEESSPYTRLAYEGGGAAAAPVASAACNGERDEATSYLDAEDDMDWSGLFAETGDEASEPFDVANPDME